MQAVTDHQIIMVNPDRMLLLDSNASIGESPIVVEANRNGNGDWVISASGKHRNTEKGGRDITVPPDIHPGPTRRGNAVSAMVSHALSVLPGEGYSVVVPRGLRETP